jgi:hypothetical protein
MAGRTITVPGFMTRTISSGLERTMSEQDELSRISGRLKVYTAAIDTHRRLTHPDHRTIMDTALYALTIDNEGYGDD